MLLARPVFNGQPGHTWELPFIAPRWRTDGRLSVGGYAAFDHETLAALDAAKRERIEAAERERVELEMQTAL